MTAYKNRFLGNVLSVWLVLCTAAQLQWQLLLFLELQTQPCLALFCLWSLNVDGDVVPLQSNCIHQC